MTNKITDETMTDKKDGGFAFPHDPYKGPTGGMTLRDWFAGQALAGIYGKTFEGVNLARDHVAVECYRQADAMLEIREQEKSGG